VPAFSYVAVDPQGKTKRGVIEAEAPRQARAGLRSEGLVPLEVAALGAQARAGRRALAGGRLVLLTRRLALLLEAGLGVEQSLNALIEQEEHEPSRRVLAAVRADVLAGQPLAAALEQHPSSFPELYRALVASGEQSGELAGVMSRLADYLEGRQALRQETGLALLYPGIVAAMALLIMAGLLLYVVPQVVGVFERSGQGLPLLTRALIAASSMASQYWFFIGTVLVGISVAAALAYRQPAVRARCHAMILRLPVLGPIARGADTARLAATLAILAQSGVPLLQALAAGSKVVGNVVLRAAVADACVRVREGSSLHRALGAGRRFPAIFVHLVASGESSGRLAPMLFQAAKQQELENAARLRLLTGLLEPAVVVLMGVLVLLFVLAVLLPIIQMNSLVRL
jgi:general secretion pathway protein F